jgi:hypothetical protein
MRAFRIIVNHFCSIDMESSTKTRMEFTLLILRESFSKMSEQERSEPACDSSLAPPANPSDASLP